MLKGNAGLIGSAKKSWKVSMVSTSVSNVKQINPYILKFVLALLNIRNNNIRRRQLQQQSDSGFNTSVYDSESDTASISEHMNVNPNEEFDGDNIQNNSLSSTDSAVHLTQSTNLDNNPARIIVNVNDNSSSDEEDTTYNYGNISEDNERESDSSDEDDFMSDRQTTDDYSEYRQRIFDYSPRQNRCNKVLVQEIDSDSNITPENANKSTEPLASENNESPSNSQNVAIEMKRVQESCGLEDSLGKQNTLQSDIIENDGTTYAKTEISSMNDSQQDEQKNNDSSEDADEEKAKATPETQENDKTIQENVETTIQTAYENPQSLPNTQTNSLSTLRVSNNDAGDKEQSSNDEDVQNERTATWKTVCDRLRKELNEEEEEEKENCTIEDAKEPFTHKDEIIPKKLSESTSNKSTSSIDSGDEDETVSAKELLLEIASNNYVKCTNEQRELVTNYIKEKAESIRKKSSNYEDHNNAEQRRVMFDNQEDYERLIQIYAKKTIDEEIEEQKDDIKPNNKESQELIQLYKSQLHESSSEDEQNEDEPYYKKLDTDSSTECKKIEFLDEDQEVYERETKSQETSSNENIDDVKELLQWELNINREKVVVLQPRIVKSDPEQLPKTPRIYFEQVPVTPSNIQPSTLQSPKNQHKEVTTEYQRNGNMQNSEVVSKSISEIREEMRKFTEKLSDFTKQFNKEYKCIINKCNQDWEDFVSLREADTDFDLKTIKEKRVQNEIQNIDHDDDDDEEDLMTLNDDIEFLENLKSQEILDQIDSFENLEPINLEITRPQLTDETKKPRDLYKEFYCNNKEISDDDNYYVENVNNEEPIDKAEPEIVLTKEIKNNVNYLVQNESLIEESNEEEEFKEENKSKNEEKLIKENPELFTNLGEEDLIINKHISCTIEMQIAKEQNN